MCSNAGFFGQWLCGFGFKFDNSPNARSVKIVLRSGKSQGIFWVLMGGNLVL